jgi:hypothetical protein
MSIIVEREELTVLPELDPACLVRSGRRGAIIAALDAQGALPKPLSVIIQRTRPVIHN